MMSQVWIRCSHNKLIFDLLYSYQMQLYFVTLRKCTYSYTCYLDIFFAMLFFCIFVNLNIIGLCFISIMKDYCEWLLGSVVV